MTEKLKVGLLDLLTLLLPGGFLLFILNRIGFVAKFIPGNFQIKTDGYDSWPTAVLFIATSYVAGHFIYLLASNLDDWIYENARKVFWPDRRLAAYILERKKEITGIGDRSVMNGFKWSCAWLLKNAPTMYAEVERLMAESKFFRSLVVVCFISFVLLIFCYTGISLLMLVMSFLSLFRYLTQRQKSIDAAYIYMVTSLAETKSFPPQPDREKLFDLTRSIIFIPGLRATNGSEIKQINRNWQLFANYWRKIFAVIKLCILPSYGYDVLPAGVPSFKSSELRWFFDFDNQAFKDWLLQYCAKEYKPDERPDRYYVREGMDEVSIKDRGQKGVFEIKRKLPYDEKILLAQGISANLEGWYKWIINEKDKAAFEKMLDPRKYREIEVSKKRWKAIIQTTAGGCQVEYTIVGIKGMQEYYSIAIELPYGASADNAMQLLKDMPIINVLQLNGAEPMSYPAFLQDKLRTK